MDHKEQHHQHHIKEREHEKKEHKAHEREHGKNYLPFHPSWLLVIGGVLALVAILIWTMLARP
jgi:hypothetical protein